MFAALTLVAIFIICTFIVLRWMSRAPRIEDEIDLHASVAAENEDDLQKRRDQSVQQKAKGA